MKNLTQISFLSLQLLFSDRLLGNQRYWSTWSISHILFTNNYHKLIVINDEIKGIAFDGYYKGTLYLYNLTVVDGTCNHAKNVKKGGGWVCSL